MKIYTDVESNAILLLQQLERDIEQGLYASTEVILAMHYLKKAIQDSDDRMGTDLEALKTQIKKAKELN